MIDTFTRFYRRIKALRKVQLQSDNARFIFHRDVRIDIADGGKIVVNGGTVTLGFPLSDSPFASFDESYISIGKNSQLIFNGPVAIAPGATIRVRDGGIAVFEGENFVSHNFLLIAEKRVKIARNVGISWNVTLIDDDGHFFETSSGKPLKTFYRPLVIEKNVGIQMNVQVPRGVTIGENAVVSAGTVLRRDVPSNCLAYQDSSLKIREGIFAPRPKQKIPARTL